MPTYIYETIPANSNEEPIVYEVTHDEDETPLTHHPETGEAWKRVEFDGKPLMKEDGGCCGEGGCCEGGKDDCDEGGCC